MKIELTNQQIQFLEIVAKKVNLKNGERWYYIPYWYKHVDGNSFEEVTFEKLPEGLKTYINNLKEKK